MLEEWDIVGVIATLVALFAAVAAPIIKLNTTITKLTVTVDSLTTKVSEMNSGNEKEHDELWKKCEEHDGALSDHTTRIVRLEERQPRRSKA